MESTVKITITDLEALAKHAREIGTTGRWVNIALEWARQAQAEINRLEDILDRENIDYAPQKEE